MRKDQRGLTLSTASAEAAAAYREGLDLMLAAWPGALAAFDRALAADPRFAAAHLARGRQLQIMGRVAEAKQAVAAARATLAGATEREASQVAILERALAGDGAVALSAALAHIAAHPRDALVLSLPLGAFGLYAFSGRPDHDRARAALCDAVAAHYRDDWWFEGYRGWSYAEAGALAAGLAHLQRALELRPCNANAVHGLAHARHDRGEIDEGRRETETFLPHYDRAGTLNAHLAWHLALFALERDDVAAALDLYESRIAPDVSQAPPLNTLTDAASLLWRVLLRDPARPLPWEEIAAYGAERFATAGLAFADLHAALLEAVTGRRETLARRLAALEALVATGRLPAGPVVPVLCRGFAAFAAGAYDEAADLLVPALPDAARIGGSGAQRDMIEDTAIAACLRADRKETARMILRRRFACPASPRP
ncbi:tetratricopeptide repeat protein [Elioraea sp. Yellowstone]|jgi:tetratricopeptide (TPR) repeat protein|uniref:tetratricopeptide repeat protein n=1 Tax=Elioraea sp. Yellowstone TaxID=2592070 RepID=UPI0011502DE2|nr:tetratricopeptide repeat protein [Elioraea sp. Yellowstone]TQF82466.1 tetratricopeptide repeat protein [Elioraea sp. Yellowstone]